MKIKQFLMVAVFAILLSMIPTTGLSQNYKSEIRILDIVENSTEAGIRFAGISKSQLDEISVKAKSINVYTVSTEFYDDKNIGFISLKASTHVSVFDFQGVLKQLGISSFEYNGKTLTVNELEANYKPLNKTEVINKQRN